MPTRRATPCDNDDGRSSSTSPSCSSSTTSCTSAVAAGRPGRNRSVRYGRRDWSSEATSRFSRTVISSNSSTACHDRTMPARARRSTDQRSMTASPKRTDPLDGVVKPVTTSRIVVLPAPFGPMSPTTSPGSMAKLTPSTATTPPNFTTRSLTASVAAAPLRARRATARASATGRGKRSPLDDAPQAGPTVPRPAAARATTAPRCRRAPGAAPRSRRDPTAPRATTRCRCPTGRSSGRRRCRARWARPSR